MKRLLSLLLSLTLLLTLCACGSETEEVLSLSAGSEGANTQSAPPEGSGTELVLKSRELQPFSAGITVRGMARIDNTILFSLSDAGSNTDGGRHSLALAEYDLAEDGALHLSEPRELPLDEPEAPEEAFLYDVAAGGDGCFYVLTGELPETYMHGGELMHNNDRQNSYHILRYTPAGELTDALSLPAFALDKLRGLAALDKEHVLLYGDEGCALIDSTGQILHQERLGEEFFTVSAQRCGERVILSTFKPTGEGFYQSCDLRDGSVQTLASEGEEGVNWASCQGLGDEYLTESAGLIRKLDPETGDGQDLMRWNYRNMGCAGLLRLADQAFLCRADRSGTLTYAYMTERQTREKQTVKVAIYFADDYMGLASSAKAALQGFENVDGGYHFEISEYTEEELDKLLTRLSAADAPDLVIFNRDINTASSAFLDLYILLDCDPELSRESFLPQFLEDLSVNGELHELWTEVNISTLAARVSDVGDGKGLTTADYDRILAESDQYQAVFQPFMDKVNLLRFVSVVGISRYVNRADGSCSFDDPSFRELLAWCSQMCDEYPEGSDDMPVLYAEDVVLWLEWLQSPQRISLMRDNVFHEPFVFVGFPTGDDMGSYFTMEGCAMAIPAAAANPEGAWAFLRSRMLPQEQDRKYFPVNWESFLRLVRQAESSDEDLALLQDLLEHTGFAENIADEPLREIVMDCGMAYLRREKTLDETIELLQSRASIYMAERYG